LLFDRRVQEVRIEGMRRQQPDQVPKEQEQDADVEQVAAPAQQPGAQHLRRVAFPGVLVAVKAQQAAEQKHRQTDVGVDPKKKTMQGGHCCAPWEESAWRADLGTMWMGWAWSGRAWPLDEQP